MQELKAKDVLTTGEVAKICNVAPRTVSKWFDSGSLKGYRIPGSKDRRIPLNHLVRFMKDHDIPLNGLKTGLSVVDATVSVVIFGLFGPVQWVAVAVAAPCALVGGYLGAHVARRVDERVLRWGVVVFSFGVAAYLAFS